MHLLHRDAVLPAYAKPGDAGADLSSVAEVTLAPGERAAYHPGYYGAFVLDPDGHNIEAVNHNRPA